MIEAGNVCVRRGGEGRGCAGRWADRRCGVVVRGEGEQEEGGRNFLLIAQTVKPCLWKMHGTSVRNTIICMAQRTEAAHATLLDTQALKTLKRHNGSWDATGGRTEWRGRKVEKRDAAWALVIYAAVITACTAMFTHPKWATVGLQPQMSLWFITGPHSLLFIFWTSTWWKTYDKEKTNK